MEKLNQKIQDQFLKMCETGKLFRSEISGHEVWDLYLKSFSKEDDPVFRDPESTVHNCNHCNNFIRRYGNIVAIDEDGRLTTLFDISDDGEYKSVVKTLSSTLKSAKIKDVFFETFGELKSLPYESCSKANESFRLGIDKNVKRYTKEEAELFGVVKPNELRTFHHFNLYLPKKFVDFSGKSIEQIMAFYRDKYQVFKRAMEEIPLDTLNLVKDLINQGSLLDGTAHLHSVNEIITHKIQYESTVMDRKLWIWDISYSIDERVAKFKNTLIGVLCTELAEGEELNKACQNWNKRVDPINYHKAVAPITKRQIEEAQKFVEENGFAESFDRRLATIDDIKIDEILHSNVGDGSLKSASFFDNIKPTSTRHKRSEFEGVEEIGIEKFMKDILPQCTSVEAFLKNNHEGNLVAITTSNNSDSKPIFKWSNNYSWTFNGNLAGKSQIKEAVKGRGGNVNGDLRISLSFPNTTDDYDLHVIDSCGNHIDYNSVRNTHNSSGVLDLDAQGVDGHQSSEKRVENVVFTDKSKLRDGEIKIWVENYSRRGIHTSFDIEVEFNGEITLLESSTSTKNKMDVGLVSVNSGMFSIYPSSGVGIKESSLVSKEFWGLETNRFHKVNLVCLSPNHWGGNSAGNLHYMFMLNDCRAEGGMRGFHNENLTPELLNHRKVMEVLGATKTIEPKGNHLAGIGFNSTVRDDLIVKLSGNFKRVIKIKF